VPRLVPGLVPTPIRWPQRMWRPVSSARAFQSCFSESEQPPAFLLLAAQLRPAAWAPKHRSVSVESQLSEPALRRRKLASRSR